MNSCRWDYVLVLLLNPAVTSLHVTAAVCSRPSQICQHDICRTLHNSYWRDHYICPSRRVFRILLSKNAETSYTLLFWPQILIFLGPGVFLAFCLFPAQMGTFTPSLTSFCWPPPACDCGALCRCPYRNVLYSVMIVFMLLLFFKSCLFSIAFQYSYFIICITAAVWRMVFKFRPKPKFYLLTYLLT